MIPDIYYFSGTGNSFAVARDIAAHITGKRIPIPSVIHNEVISPESDVFGIVYPSSGDELCQ